MDVECGKNVGKTIELEKIPRWREGRKDRRKDGIWMVV